MDLIRRILQVFERHRLWDEGVELIGSWCFLLYQRHLGVKPYPFKTQDVDFLLPYPYKGRAKVDLVAALERLGFRRDFRPDGSIYLRNPELSIDFIIPERGRGRERAVEIKPLSLKALPLRFVDMLLQHPIALIEGGIAVSVPDPAAFCLHKLLIAGRRRRADSRRKDLEQALHVVPVLKKAMVKRVYQELPKGWQRTILQTLGQARADMILLRDEAQQLLDTLHSLK